MSEALTFGGVNLNVTGAWRIVDYSPLYGRGPARGSGIVLPGVDGELARARRRGAWTFPLTMYVFGNKVGQTGATGFPGHRNMVTNLTYLRGVLLPPYAANAATLTLTHTLPDASSVSAGAVVEQFLVAPHDGSRGEVSRVALTVHVPAGALT